jgi:hypothetical protein
MPVIAILLIIGLIVLVFVLPITASSRSSEALRAVEDLRARLNEFRVRLAALQQEVAFWKGLAKPHQDVPPPTVSEPVPEAPPPLSDTPAEAAHVPLIKETERAEAASRPVVPPPLPRAVISEEPIVEPPAPPVPAPAPRRAAPAV